MLCCRMAVLQWRRIQWKFMAISCPSPTTQQSAQMRAMTYTQRHGKMPLPKITFKWPVMVFWWRDEPKAVPVQQRMMRGESQKETESCASQGQWGNRPRSEQQQRLEMWRSTQDSRKGKHDSAFCFSIKYSHVLRRHLKLDSKTSDNI